MSKTRRINLFGGPGCGKTTMSARIFSDLKREGYNIEMGDEYVKQWTYTGTPPVSFDQLYILAKIIRHEDIRLRNGVDLIVTDAPILINCYYAKHLGCSFWEQEIEIVKKYEEQYPSLNIFLEVDRDKEKYDSHGRFQSKEEAKRIDSEMEKFILTMGKKPIFKSNRNDYLIILDYIKSQIGDRNDRSSNSKG